MPARANARANVYLIGPSGTGKSSVAPILADLLRLRAVDTDALIAQSCGAPAAEVFAVRGEPAFRAIEAQIVATVCAREHQVVALGGGAPLDPLGFARMRATGIVVYLRAQPATLAARLATSADRPVLARAQGHTLEERIASVLGEREAVYARAHAIVETDGRTRADVAAAVVERLALVPV